MAVTAVTTSMAGAINYTFTTDTSADFASVANSTYFYNKADKLVRYKDSTGTVLEIFSASGGSTDGVFGISNSSGVYTYYATLTLAMAAAVSGNVIEMFANYTETGAVTITLKNGVDINGNGYTYTLNNTGGNNAFVITDSIVTSCKISNITITRAGNIGTTAYCLTTGTNSSGVIDFNNAILRNTGGSAAIFVSSAHDINNLTAYGVAGGAIKVGTSAGARINNSIGYATGGGIGIATNNGGDLYNCTGYSDSGNGILSGAGMSVNCIGISTSGIGMTSNNYAYNCVGRSNSGAGFTATSATIINNCSGFSVSSTGFYVGASVCTNCHGWSSSGFGARFDGNVYAVNLTSHSVSSASVWSLVTSNKIYGGHISSDWNNAGGYGIRGNGGSIGNIILNCVIRLSNASAPYIYNDAIAQAITMRGNTYSGGGAIAANLTQAIVNTEDNQGNIYL